MICGLAKDKLKREEGKGVEGGCININFHLNWYRRRERREFNLLSCFEILHYHDAFIFKKSFDDLEAKTYHLQITSVSNQTH